MNSRAILLAELEEKSHKNKELRDRSGEREVAGLGEGYDPYDNPGIHKTSRIDDTAARRVLRRP